MVTTAAPADLLRKLDNKIKALEVIGKHSDYTSEVLADLREGKPVIVVREGFKWEGEIIPRLSEFNPGPEFVPRVAQLMESFGRYFVPKPHIEALEKIKVYRRIAAELAPLVGAASALKAQAAQARDAEGRARTAVDMYKFEAEQAEAKIPAAERALADYMSTLDIDI